MAILPLVYAPNPVFKQKAAPVETVDDSIRALIDDMFETLAVEHAIGMGANMVGILKRIAITNVPINGEANPYTFINPHITWHSNETEEQEEASICFPGISAEIKRPKAIKISYLDYDGNQQELEADGFLACVIQHEVDYLDGITFLDHLSKLKRDMLMKKMLKHIKTHPPHVHGPGCNH